MNINFVGKRILIADAATKSDRPAKIVTLFDDKHYVVEFEDNQERREIYVKAIKIGEDIVK